jgi:Icc-related predicted phosphoesterase
MTVDSFQGWYVPETARTHHNVFQDGRSSYERIMYVGCVHGGDQALIDRLAALAQDPPHVLIFTGDLTGAEEMEEFKQRFYNFVAKRARTVLSENPVVSDDELLEYVGLAPPMPNMTIKEGYLHLLAYQLKLQGFSPTDIDSHLNRLSKQEIAREIRTIASYRYYGNWVATLSRPIREAVLSTLERSARRLLEPINQLRSLGVEIVMLEGNWDNPALSGVRFIAGDDITDYFDTKAFFVSQGLRFVDQLSALETQTTIQVLLPYFTILNYDKQPPDRTEAIRTLITHASASQKAVIMVGHAVVSPHMHRLFIANPDPAAAQTPESRHFMQAIATFQPDEVIYGHEHDPIKDETGRPVDPNAKYLLEIRGPDAEVHVVANPDAIGTSEHQVVVTFLPLKGIAELNMPREGPRKIFGGNRSPIMLLDANP